MYVHIMQSGPSRWTLKLMHSGNHMTAMEGVTAFRTWPGVRRAAKRLARQINTDWFILPDGTRERF